MDLFHGWGADLVTVFEPNSHLRWAAGLGASYPRGDLWGDFTSSAWNYFGYTLLALAIVGAVIVLRRRNVWAMAVLVVGGVALVLSLGPALKFDSVVPPEVLAANPGGRLQPPGPGWLRRIAVAIRL